MDRIHLADVIATKPRNENNCRYISPAGSGKMYIDENYQESIDLNGIAQQAFLSWFHFHRYTDMLISILLIHILHVEE